MNGAEFVDCLIKQFGNISQNELAKLLGKRPVQLSAYRKSMNLSPLTVARLMKNLNAQIVRGKDLLPAIRESLGTKNESESAALLGMTPAALSSWKSKRRGISVKQVANAIKVVRAQAKSDAHATVYKPIIELFPITPILEGKKYKVFDSDGGKNKQRTGLKNELQKTNGIYIFFDARGKALYVGKAKEQSIWGEMNNAFVRRRNSQKIALVKHPTNNVEFKAAHEKLRQPLDTARTLINLAAYFSAYKVEKSLIDDFEALFIRAFPNDLLNYKIEKPGKAKKATAPKSRAKSKTRTVLHKKPSQKLAGKKR